jgi:hypothetical protein
MTMSACIYQLRLPQLTNTDPCSKNKCGYILEHYVERKSRVGEITPQTFMVSGSFVAHFNGKRVMIQLQPTWLLLETEGDLAIVRKSMSMENEVGEEGLRPTIPGKFYLLIIVFPLPTKSSDPMYTFQNHHSPMMIFY